MVKCTINQSKIIVIDILPGIEDSKIRKFTMTSAAGSAVLYVRLKNITIAVDFHHYEASWVCLKIG